MNRHFPAPDRSRIAALFGNDFYKKPEPKVENKKRKHEDGTQVGCDVFVKVAPETTVELLDHDFYVKFSTIFCVTACKLSTSVLSHHKFAE